MTAKQAWLGSVLALVIGATSSQLSAAEPAGLKLLRLDSLAGWEHGPTKPVHWSISQGRLTGSAQSTPLLSGWTVGDFELRFQWSVGSGGVWQVGLPDVPSGPGLLLTFKEGDGCGAVRASDQVLSSGAKIEPLAAGAMHTADIRRSGGTLSIIVDGKVTGEVSLDRNRRFGLALSVSAGEGTLADLRLEEPRGNSLFNGKDLSGWFINNNKGEWKVDNGDIIPIAHKGLHYLRPDKEYANFTLSLDYTISRGGNSGLAIRTAKDGWPSGDGMELQILDQPGEVKDSTMAIYGNLPPLDRADKSLEWNRITVKADGRMISAWINGELVQQVNTVELPELKHRHLKGWIGVQDHGGKVRFHEIYIHEAPEGLGLDAWYQPHPEPAAGIVLDRVMNSERLSRVDGLGSGVVSKTVPKGGEHVLAELTGPGALVRCWRSFAAGRMAFYFDGETEPRIECDAEHLFDHVPGIAHQEQPVLGCLNFAKSLKIVVTDPLPATYRFDYVTFPKDVPVESFTRKNPGVPRGMPQAISYRHEGMAGGKLREAEIYDRINSEPRTIEPGTTVQLASVEGAGIVNWLRLQTSRTALADDNLWVEVTIDGESVPAIAAPARFLYPAFAGTEDTKDFNSLVLTSKEGFANLLAMPFGNGISVAVRNRGSKPIEKVAVSMSVNRANDKNRADIAGRMRLRGVFQSADSDLHDLINQSGGGRWVALIYQQPEGTTGVASLDVDGKPREGWASPDLESFWGKPGEGNNFYRALSGRKGGLAWRYMLLEPVSFEHSLVLKPNPGDKLGDRLALFYLKK